jgi:hypothetical protein
MENVCKSNKDDNKLKKFIDYLTKISDTPSPFQENIPSRN